MSPSPRHTRRLVAWTAAAALGGLALAGGAAAAPSAPSGLTVTPESPTAADAVTVNFAGSTPDDGATITGYQGGVDGDLSPISDNALIPVPTGVHSIRVQAVQSDGQLSDFATVPIVVDRAAPSITVSLAGTQSNGWFRSLQVKAVCDDDSPLPAGACPPAITWTTSAPTDQGPVTMTVTDVMGRTTSSSSPAFKFDNVRPSVPQAEDLGDFISSEPTFKWLPSTDADSGVARYLVQFRIPDPDADTPPPWNTIANVPSDGRLGQYAAKRDPDLRAAPLPDFQKFEWRVQAIDVAGNTRTTDTFSTTIDPTTPPPPTITGGPNAPTRDQSPTFTWDGAGPQFQWDLLPAGATGPIRSGGGTAQQVQLSSLPDGNYTFQLSQITAAGRRSELASRSFTVDTTPPAPPTILTRPTFPSLGDAIFTWSTEPGAYSRWNVVDRNNGTVVAPTDTPVTSATLPSLAEDAYTFSVQQIDAAGNVSPATVEPFTVIAPLVAPSPSANIVTLLPKQNAKRLQPKAGKTLFSRSPVLRWSRGPKGTKLFNLQIFRVTLGRNAKTPKVSKILSVFPKARAYRVPKSKTQPKTCYVWRVWPYTGREFTPKPLGVSNYCIAGKRALAKKAQIIAKRKAAKIAARSRR